ncbi:hypothetical protein D2910_06635 [Planomicrobium okeanokoites]|nr:hypothetical protein D2910_06635 [Planomicrobium okeanokoites]
MKVESLCVFLTDLWRIADKLEKIADKRLKIADKPKKIADKQGKIADKSSEIADKRKTPTSLPHFIRKKSTLLCHVVI